MHIFITLQIDNRSLVTLQNRVMACSVSKVKIYCYFRFCSNMLFILSINKFGRFICILHALAVCKFARYKFSLNFLCLFCQIYSINIWFFLLRSIPIYVATTFYTENKMLKGMEKLHKPFRWNSSKIKC